jgi:hypothetical protein
MQSERKRLAPTAPKTGFWISFLNFPLTTQSYGGIAQAFIIPFLAIRAASPGRKG